MSTYLFTGISPEELWYRAASKASKPKCEAMLPKEETKPERRNDWRAVNNYISALDEAIKKLEFLPLSSRLLKEAHKDPVKVVYKARIHQTRRISETSKLYRWRWP